MPGNKRVVFVVGMHRSGTSALTRSLQVLGIDLGSNHLPSSKDNEKGYFEDSELVRLNTRLMHRLGIDWDTASLLHSDQLLDEKVSDIRAEAVAFLKKKLSGRTLIGFKDPRVSRLLPFWLSILDELACDVSFVLSMRSPSAVVNSLAKRDGFSYAKSLALWLVYTLDAIVHTQGFTRFVIPYHELLDNPAGSIRLLAAGLGLRVNELELQEYVHEFIDRKLDRSSREAQIDDVASQSYLDIANRLFSEVERSSLEAIETSGYYRFLKEEQASLQRSNQADDLAEYVDCWKSGVRMAPALAQKLSDEIGEQAMMPVLHLAITTTEASMPEMIETLESLERDLSLGIEVQVSVFAPGVREHYPQLSDVLISEFVSLDAGFSSQFSEWLSRKGTRSWVLLMRSGERFIPYMLATLMLDLARQPQCMAVYCDEFIPSDTGGTSILLRPDMNIDFLLSYPSALVSHWLFRVEELMKAVECQSLELSTLQLDLVLYLVGSFGLGGIGHQPTPLVHGKGDIIRADKERESILQHLRMRGYENASVTPGSRGTWRISYGHSERPLVSIIVPTRDQLPLLQTCVESVLEKTSYQNYEILVVDNNSETPEAKAWLKGLEDMGLPNLRVLRYNKPFNFSAINNYAVSEAKGDYVLLLNNDTGILSSEWLDELMNHGQRPEVGIVGAKLLFPSGKVQHAGVVMGMRGPAEHICIGSDADDPGYMNRLAVDQNYSAVTAACMLVRKSVYEQVGGLDEEAFSVSYNDIDFCLKVAQLGLLTVWTPRAVVMHVANASQISVDKTPDKNKVKRFREEQESMFERWLPYMGNDPAFNRNLSLKSVGFEIDHRIELSWQPHRAVDLPTILVQPADKWGCGHYRMIQPLESMEANAIAGGMVSFGWLTVPELARLNPDALVYQRQITEHAVEHMKQAKRLLKKPTVYELDDYLPNLPLKSAYRQNMPKDILKSLRRSLKHVDRFVVSTQPLAEAFSGMHHDIQVVENCLPIDWWGDLSSLRNQSEKPRVGWAGGMGHTGDLELVEAVVKELAGEVDWVFFGMCPDGLRPFVKEIHEGIEISQYPRKLASLNLDLAIAPLEDNLFNRCKSNLRLLEYGACGFPVVCSDVEPYQTHGLPVTRVKNRFKDWVDAVRMHLSDLDETARSGDLLQQVVRQNWMLEGENLRRWRDAWTKF